MTRTKSLHAPIDISLSNLTLIIIIRNAVADLQTVSNTEAHITLCVFRAALGHKTQRNLCW